MFHASFWTEFDLNLPLDEFGAVDLDFLQNMTGIYLNSHVNACISLNDRSMLHDL
jgi:hypothetical protein